VQPGLLAFDMGTATRYSPKRHGTSALVEQQGSHVPADAEAAQGAPHGDAGSRSGDGPGRHRPSAGARPRPSRATYIRGTSDHLGP
jgi:hypothetical protein